MRPLDRSLPRVLRKFEPIFLAFEFIPSFPRAESTRGRFASQLSFASTSLNCGSNRSRSGGNPIGSDQLGRWTLVPRQTKMWKASDRGEAEGSTRSEKCEAIMEKRSRADGEESRTIRRFLGSGIAVIADSIVFPRS